MNYLNYIINNGVKYIHMNIHSNKIIEFIEKKRVITSSELAKFLKISWNTADKYLLELIIDGKVDRIKKAGVTLWVLKEEEKKK